jgi:hypothetical protein
MKYKGHLMMGLMGLALLAAPITASAQKTDGRKNESHQSQSNNKPAELHSYNLQPRSGGPERSFAPAPEGRNDRSQAVRNESRDERVNRTTSNDRDHDIRNRDRDDRNYVNRDHDRDYHRDFDRDYHRDYDRDYHRDFDHDYDGRHVEGYYVMPRGYAGGACAWARHLRGVYRHDRETGHPDAANDLLPQLRKAERSCGGGPYVYLR